MEWFWLWALPMVLMIFLNLYQRFNLTHPVDRFWSILWILSSMAPILNWICFGSIIVIMTLTAFNGDLPKDLMKDTRLNRWLFKSLFED